MRDDRCPSEPPRSLCWRRVRCSLCRPEGLPISSVHVASTRNLHAIETVKVLSGSSLGFLEPPVSRARGAHVPPRSHPQATYEARSRWLREHLLLITRDHESAQSRQARILCPPPRLLTGSTDRVKRETRGCKPADEDSPFDHESSEKCSAAAGHTLSPLDSPSVEAISKPTRAQGRDASLPTTRDDFR